MNYEHEINENYSRYDKSERVGMAVIVTRDTGLRITSH